MPQDHSVRRGTDRSCALFTESNYHHHWSCPCALSATLAQTLSIHFVIRNGATRAPHTEFMSNGSNGVFISAKLLHHGIGRHRRGSLADHTDVAPSECPRADIGFSAPLRSARVVVELDVGDELHVVIIGGLHIVVHPRTDQAQPVVAHDGARVAVVVF